MTPRVAGAAALLAGLVSLLPAAPATGQVVSLAPFEIKDQFDSVHRHMDYTGRILIVIGSDRKGSAFHDDWETAIRDSLATGSRSDEVAYLSVADVRGVPFFLKGSVKGKFSKDPEEWVLLDWNGSLAKDYGFERDAATIVVFASDGALVGKVWGREVIPDVLAVVLTTVRSLLRE